MNPIFQQYKILLKRLLLLFAMYSALRLAFFISNSSYFKSLSIIEVFGAFLAGLRFDLVAITISNILFITMHFLPVKVFYTKWYQRLIGFFFFLINVFAIIFNAVDCAYFKFILKRSTADLLQLIFIGNDTANNLGAMAATFWYAPLILLIMLVLIIRGYKKIKIDYTLKSQKVNGKNLIYGWLLVLPLAGITLVAFRGGTQYKPLGILAAAQYTNPQNAPLVLNTTFTIIKTAFKDEVLNPNYFSDAECLTYFNAEKNYASDVPFNRINVVEIILESIGKEYIGYFNKGKGYTPFFDSLLNQSLTFRYSFANAKKSIEGIPAVTASIPALMTSPFISSVYNGNNINSIASILKPEGYTSAFFHGGNNGTMGFDNFTRMAGYDYYLGKNEYEKAHGTADYDGNWGIFDESFYGFFVEEMNKMNPPFVTTIFTISSHHPYIIPEKHKDKFPKGTLPVHESVGYSDYSLKTFFEKAAKQPWYSNTLFVITADHTSEAEASFYQNKMGIYSVPVLYFMPGINLKGQSDKITQQCDIMPSILDFMNYNKPFVAFGESVFDSAAQHFSAQFMDDSYQVFYDDQLLQFDGERPLTLYNFQNDSLLKTDLLLQPNPKYLYAEKKLKAYIQQFNQRLIQNKMNTAVRLNP